MGHQYMLADFIASGFIAFDKRVVASNWVMNQTAAFESQASYLMLPHIKSLVSYWVLLQ